MKLSEAIREAVDTYLMLPDSYTNQRSYSLAHSLLQAGVELPVGMLGEIVTDEDSVVNRKIMQRDGSQEIRFMCAEFLALYFEDIEAEDEADYIAGVGYSE